MYRLPSFILDSFMTELPSFTRNASLAYWFHIKPVFASPASHVDSGLGICGLDICLGGYSDSFRHGLNTIRFVATADPGTQTLYIQRRHQRTTSPR
jgi:hypothetical protein